MKVSLFEKIAYACGDFGSNGAYLFINTFIMVFFTDILGINAATAGTITMIIMFWDAINDPIVGLLVDRSRAKGTKLTKWLRIGAFPVGIFLALLFFAPSFSMGGKIAWAIIIYALYDLASTIYQCPLGSLSAVMTNDSEQRIQLGAFRDWGANFGGFIVNTFATGIIMFFGHGEMNAKGFFIATCIIAVFVIVAGNICAFGCKERVPAPEGETVNFKTGLKSIFSHRSSIAALAVVLIANTFIGTKATFTTYYAMYVLGDPMFIMYILMVMSCVPLLGILFVPIATKKLGRKTMFMLGGIFSVLSGVIHLFCGTNIVLIEIASVLCGLVLCCSITVMWGAVPDIADYGEYLTGTSSTNLYYSLINFAMKCATAIASQFIGILLDSNGYDGALEVQSEQCVKAISTTYGVAPIIFGALIIVAAFFFVLTPEKMKEVQKTLTERHTKA